MTAITVVAAVVERDGRLFLGRRPDHKRHPGLWELPGGKVDPGETIVDAVRRELDEELSVSVTDVGARLFAVADEASGFVIEFYPVTLTGEPQAVEHSAIGWFAVDEMEAMPLAPADARFVAWYRVNR